MDIKGILEQLLLVLIKLHLKLNTLTAPDSTKTALRRFSTVQNDRDDTNFLKLT